MSQPQFVLATSSKYKTETFNKLGIPYRTIVPNIDESALGDESPQQLVMRLSQQKALEAYKLDKERRSCDIYYIGIDQVATFNGKIIGKSHTVENAVSQLTEFSGNSVEFLTGITVLQTEDNYQSIVEPFNVVFKSLTSGQIEKYVAAEMPLDCAGSFKCEGQGIILFENLSGRDINSLVGMPLIAFQELCLKFEIDLFDLIG